MYIEYGISSLLKYNGKHLLFYKGEEEKQKQYLLKEHREV